MSNGPINELPSRWNQLRLLRGITATTGILHEGQILQLKYWPRIVLPHSKSCETLVYTTETRVEIQVLLSKRKPPKHMKKRLSKLTEWVKELLGPQYGVRILLDGKVAVDSPGKRLKPPKKTRPDDE